MKWAGGPAHPSGAQPCAMPRRPAPPRPGRPRRSTTAGTAGAARKAKLGLVESAIAGEQSRQWDRLSHVDACQTTALAWSAHTGFAVAPRGCGMGSGRQGRHQAWPKDNSNVGAKEVQRKHVGSQMPNVCLAESCGPIIACLSGLLDMFALAFAHRRSDSDSFCWRL